MRRNLRKGGETEAIKDFKYTKQPLYIHSHGSCSYFVCNLIRLNIRKHFIIAKGIVNEMAVQIS